MKILILYMELADYTVQCLKKLKLAHPEVSIHTVAYPINDEAPFNFDFTTIGKLYNRDKFDHEKLQLFVDKIDPQLIICSGWKDKSYLKVIRTWRNKATTVMCMDNEWHASLRQRLSALAARFFLPKVFNYIWVPYKRQGKFAKKLGFNDECIKYGFYTADTEKFSGFYEKNIKAKQAAFPKVFLCVARYFPQKNLETLWNAFVQLQNEEPNEWELWNMGTGTDFEKRFIDPKIKHLGFVQPNQMEEYIAKAGVFVLPSLFEPWGVVVHEFAASGFPLLISKHVGASQAFVENGINGYVFKPSSVENIKEALLKIMQLPDHELNQMGINSAEIAKQINQEAWVEQCMQFINHGKAVSAAL